MKRTVLILVTFVLAVLLLAGCGNSKKTDSDEGAPAASGGNGAASGISERLSKATVDVFAGGKYYMKFRTTAGNSGENSAAIMETYVKDDMVANKVQTEGMLMHTVMRDGKIYTIIHEQKMVMETDIPATSRQNAGVVETEGIVYTGSGKGDFAGRTLSYEEYSIAQENGAMRYYFDGKELAGMQTLSGGAVMSEIEIMEISSDVPGDVFIIPSDYTLVARP